MNTTRSSDIKANSPYSLSFILFWFALYYAPILNFYLPSTNFGPGIPDLGFHELILILWVLAAFIDRSIKNLTRRVHTPWITLLGIYSFIVIISVSWSRESYSSSNIRDLFYHIFVPFLFGYASTFYTLNEEFRRSLVKHATVGCVVLSLLGLINYITQYGGKIDEMRSAATLHNPNALAIFLVLNIPLVLYGIYKNVLNRNLGYLALIIILLGVLGTISRKGIITAGLSCAIFLVMKRNYKILLLSIILCALFITFSIGIEPIAKRFDEKKINEQIAGKWNMTLAGWNMFRQHPLKGLGYKGYYNEFGKYFRDSGRLKYDAHNNFITALANFGLIGIGPFLGIFLLPLKYSLNILKYFGRAISTDEQMRQLTGIAILIPFMFNAWFAGDLMYMAVITTVFYTLIGFFCISTPKSLPVATTAATLK
ncbi:MAG: O-antigen ligase family protein [Deltaproteobacteria bacterium]|nr:O-antigen ligase family protein [Deltaproteobacteria bacterium]